MSYQNHELVPSIDEEHQQLQEFEPDLYQLSKKHWIEEIQPNNKGGRKKRNLPSDYKDGFNQFDKIGMIRDKQLENIFGYSMSYTIIPNETKKNVFKKMKKKYKPQKAKNALWMWEYLHTMTYNKEDNSEDSKVNPNLKGWAFPTNEQIAEDCGISINALTELKRILVNEKLLIVKKREYKGKEKDYYLPLYFPYDE